MAQIPAAEATTMKIRAIQCLLVLLTISLLPPILFGTDRWVGPYVDSPSYGNSLAWSNSIISMTSGMDVAFSETNFDPQSDTWDGNSYIQFAEASYSLEYACIDIAQNLFSGIGSGTVIYDEGNMSAFAAWAPPSDPWESVGNIIEWVGAHEIGHVLGLEEAVSCGIP